MPMPQLPAESISVTINKPLHKVYDFLVEPMNFPLWASGLAKGLKKWGPVYMAETEDGMMKVKFSERNDFGIADHSVFPTTDQEILVPLRAIRNGSGTEVVLTLFRQPEMDDAHFKRDRDWVKKDLEALKKHLESLA